MEHGNFTELAKDYINRPGYSTTAVEMLTKYVGAYQDDFIFADVGAGTGKLTEILVNIGLKGYSIEPNDAMRMEGIKAIKESNQLKWLKGYAEETGLKDSSINWITMASSFHWANPQLALKEFHRILKPGGYFTALWNPRNIEKNELQQKIEKIIYNIVPELKRVSSGSSKHMQGLEESLLSTQYFDNLIFVESSHIEVMDKQRYLGVWRSVNDIQVQAGEERFQMILQEIEREISNKEQIAVHYKTRAWTIQKVVK